MVISMETVRESLKSGEVMSASRFYDVESGVSSLEALEATREFLSLDHRYPRASDDVKNHVKGLLGMTWCPHGLVSVYSSLLREMVEWILWSLEDEDLDLVRMGKLPQEREDDVLVQLEESLEQEMSRGLEYHHVTFKHHPFLVHRRGMTTATLDRFGITGNPPRRGEPPDLDDLVTWFHLGSDWNDVTVRLPLAFSDILDASTRASTDKEREEIFHVLQDAWSQGIASTAPLVVHVGDASSNVVSWAVTSVLGRVTCPVTASIGLGLVKDAWIVNVEFFEEPSRSGSGRSSEPSDVDELVVLLEASRSFAFLW